MNIELQDFAGYDVNTNGSANGAAPTNEDVCRWSESTAKAREERHAKRGQKVLTPESAAKVAAGLGAFTYRAAARYVLSALVETDTVSEAGHLRATFAGAVADALDAMPDNNKAKALLIIRVWEKRAERYARVGKNGQPTLSRKDRKTLLAQCANDLMNVVTETELESVISLQPTDVAAYAVRMFKGETVIGSGGKYDTPAVRRKALVRGIGEAIQAYNATGHERYRTKMVGLLTVLREVTTANAEALSLYTEGTYTRNGYTAKGTAHAPRCTFGRAYRSSWLKVAKAVYGGEPIDKFPSLTV